MTAPLKAIAFLDWGRWVADCPNPACTNARLLQRGAKTFTCDAPPDGCGQVASVEWPDNIAAVMAKVTGKPAAQQHWRPEQAK